MSSPLHLPLPRVLLVLASVFAVAAPVAAAVPGEVDYQGLLLDDQGQPVNGSADFVFTLHDAASGGALLWTESHPGVAVLDGIYDVRLGDTTPLTQTVLEGGALWLEIEVDGETLTPRQRLVAVPYARRAETAENAESVGTAPQAFVTQIYENFAFDGADPPNDDPREGVGDTDGDGLANFVDPDNDDDGIPDGDELAAGSDINLVTPTIAALEPAAMAADATATVGVQGTGFEPGMSVVFGSETPAPQNLTSTGFEVVVGPQAVGSAGVQVTRANGETASASFEFQDLQPLIAALDPLFGRFDETTLVTVQGSGFGPGLQVAFGSENPLPQNVTPTSFQVSVGPQALGEVPVTVSYGAGPSDGASFHFVDIADTDPRIAFLSSATYTGDLGGLAGADAECNALAAAASLPGVYFAWLADGSSGAPGARFAQGAWSWERVDGVKIADDLNDLTTGNLDAPLDRTETGTQLTGVTGWRGSDDGSLTCDDWSVPTGLGRVENLSFDLGTVSVPCDSQRHLFCFQQF